MKKRLLMDIDYMDLAWGGDGSLPQLEQLFDKMAQAGFAGGIVDCFAAGQALYHSRRFPLFDNPERSKNHDRVVDRIREFDPLSEIFRLSKDRKLKFHPYVRLTDDAYAPSSGALLFVNNPHYWYETRCGCYQLTGIPCFNYPEVRELFLTRCEDLVEHGAEGFFFSTCRSHCGLMVPYFGHAGWDIWGFNQPVADEYLKRHGVDIRKTGVVDVSTSDQPRLRGYRVLDYQGTEPYDEIKLRQILGEGFELFLRSVRKRFPAAYIGLEMNASAAYPGYNFPHNLFLMDLEGLATDGIINEWIPSNNWRDSTENLEDLTEKFPYLKPRGVSVGAWLNDILSSNGGDPEKKPSIDEIASYLNRVLNSPLDSCMIHEADFLLQHPEAEKIWQTLGNFSCETKEMNHGQ